MLDSMLGLAAGVEAAGLGADDDLTLPEGLLEAVVGATLGTPGVGRGPAVVAVALEAACQRW